MHMMDVCYVELPDADNFPDIYSHVTELTTHSNIDHDEVAIRFPLQGPGPFLCTQGSNGKFTHFKAETYHAVDWKCPVGTPVVAVGDGEVVEISDSNKASGIHTKNLFSWNSIMLKLTSGVFVEYVHIKANSAKVKVGDKVSEGQIICESGDVGFCPEPHLHLQVQSSNDRKAETIKFFVEDASGKKYLPDAGKWYNNEGECKK
jgi:murein DD-endopeptidase MepM/ murein hydrolase activator NlpD